MSKKRAILIGIPFHNQGEKLIKAVESILEQKDVKRNIYILLVNDDSTDNWEMKLKHILDNQNILVHNVKFHNISKLRNYILDVAKYMTDVEYIGRLDADDVLTGNSVLSNIEEIIEYNQPDVILAGNLQTINGVVTGVNPTMKKFLEYDYLKHRLEMMAQGKIEGELPSCNIFVRYNVDIRYKSVESAEDHWFLVDLLLSHKRYDIYFAENLFYCSYSLDGDMSLQNKKNRRYIQSRKKLLEYFSQIRGNYES